LTPVIEAAAPGGFLLPLALMAPVVGMLAAVAFGGRHAHRVALATVPVGLALAVAIVVHLARSGEALQYLLGAWPPPLGVRLRADGLAAAMMLVTAVVIGATALYARTEFGARAGAPEARAPFAFWPLLLAVWGALNTVFLAHDLFTLFVALELLTFAAVPLVCLDGRAETLQAALRYLLFALAGSGLYLVGIPLLYATYGTLDISLLAVRVHLDPATLTAASLMTAGLLAKTALFPLHLWLPPAHAGAPAPASTVLSALVIKGSFFVLVRLWFDVGLASGAGAQLLAALGAAAIFFGHVVALRQVRLKLLIAYSTVAQIGYLFIMFPLAFGAGSTAADAATALNGGLMQVISHATAKAAMFMSAGLIYAALGHDRVADLAGVGRAMPMSLFAFALGGIALVGLPPSGGFLAKWLLLSVSVTTGQWWWAAVMLIGGLLTACYVVLVVMRAMTSPETPLALKGEVPRGREAVALALALCSVLLGFVAFVPIDLLAIGRPHPVALGWR
jgi:formate hydrogenlyase subunit 3/multisubunit Na+/H+ antiporter MnhD subunit